MARIRRYNYGETGLIGVHGKLIIITNHNNEVHYPDILRVIHSLRMFSFDIHSHNDELFYAKFPSPDMDLVYSDSTVDGKSYIFSPYGLTAFQLPDSLPKDFSRLDQAKTWINVWRNHELDKIKRQRPGLSLREYDNIYNRQLYQAFFEENFHLRLIPWDNIQEIEKVYNNLISSKAINKSG